MPLPNSAESNDASIDGRFVTAFLASTIETLKVQCSYEIKPQKSFILTSHHKIEPEICGIIGLTSNVFSAVVSLCFQEKLFLSVMSSMFGETFTEVTDDLADGAGELLNIIFGQAKTQLTNQGLSVERAIPTIVRGEHVRLSSLTGGGTTIVVPFETKDGPLNILIALGKHKPRVIHLS